MDKDELKNSLELEQVYELLNELGGEPQIKNDYIISRTICHNAFGDGSFKMYYYDNTKLFRCYTSCNDTFDIFELILKIKKQHNEDWSLSKAIYFIAYFFGYSINIEQEDFDSLNKLEDWDIFKAHEIEIKEKTERVELKNYSKDILKHYPQPRIIPWEDDGISYEVVKSFGIRYDPIMHGIIIPHLDINNRLIGIRERTLIKEQEQYGKYKPAILSSVMYNHPLGFNLYGIEHAKSGIKRIKKAIVVEGEKSVLQYASYFGIDNVIAVACCGSALTAPQVELLRSLGVEEIIIGFDKQFKEIDDDEFKKWTKKLYDIHKKYSPYVQISFLFDKNNCLLGYKDSPMDCGKETFLQLFKERIIL